MVEKSRPVLQLKGEIIMTIDKFVEEHMRKLNNIKSMVDKTSGADRETWTKKWYDLVKIVADRIRVLHKNNNELN